MYDSNSINFGKVAAVYSKFRDELPSIIFEQLKQRDIWFQDKHVVDLGSGSGIFSRALFQQGAAVVGIDPSIELITEARKQDKDLGLTINYIESGAENVDLPNHSYDVVTVVRAWHWFDRQKVMERIKQFLKPDGYVIIISSIFLSDSTIVQQTLDVIRQCDIELKPAGSKADVKERRTGFPVNWFKEWEENNFKIIDEWQYSYELPFTLDSWCGKMKSISWMTELPTEKKNQAIRNLRETLNEFEEPLVIPHQYSVMLLKL